LKLKTGMPGQLVPYRSSNEMMLSLINGQSLYVFADVPSVLPQAQSGKVRALAVAQSSRLSELPGVPTLAEAGLADLDIKPQWNGVFAVAGTPAAIVRKLEAALQKVTADPAVRERMQGAAYRAEGVGSDAFRSRIDNDIKAYREIIRAANLKFEQ
jgi:tripartite-type tricarboxylate transporter receptor subunit TctC